MLKYRIEGFSQNCPVWSRDVSRFCLETKPGLETRSRDFSFGLEMASRDEMSRDLISRQELYIISKSLLTSAFVPSRSLSLFNKNRSCLILPNSSSDWIAFINFHKCGADPIFRFKRKL